MTASALAIGHLTGYRHRRHPAAGLRQRAALGVAARRRGCSGCCCRISGCCRCSWRARVSASLDAVLQVGLYLSLSTLTFMTSFVARRQTEAREELRVVNSELRATQLLLAEGERAGERLRISRELARCRRPSPDRAQPESRGGQHLVHRQGARSRQTGAVGQQATAGGRAPGGQRAARQRHRRSRSHAARAGRLGACAASASEVAVRRFASPTPVARRYWCV